MLETAEIAERETKDAQNSCRVSQNRNKTEVHQVAAPPRKGRTSGLGACNRCGGAHDTQQCRFRKKFADFAGNGGTLRRRVVQRKGQKEQVLERVYPQETTLIVKKLKGDDESEEEWDSLQWGSLHGLAEDKRNGMKMGKPICM